LLLVCVSVVAALAGCRDTQDHVAVTPGFETIAFDARREGAHGPEEIYLTDHNGAEIRRLTHTPSPYFSGYPRWSPDKARIAFISNRDGDEEIYVMNADGGDTHRLTHNPGDDWSHAWTPDGKMISFLWGPADVGNVYLINADGTDQRLLDPSLGAVSGDLDWSPDGTRLLFTSGRDGEGEDVYLYTVESGVVTRLTDSPGESSSANASWSPTGDNILFTSNRDGLWDVYRMDADGSDVRRLTYTESGENGSWAIAQSPDGSEVVFTSDRFGNAANFLENMELFVMKSDGSRLRRITSNRWMDGHPDW
jgi:Tol biopolymer transport system component